jgi:hypothetical protein
MADAAAWGALNPREQREKRAALEENGAHLRSLLALSGGPIRTLEYTSADPDVGGGEGGRAAGGRSVPLPPAAALAPWSRPFGAAGVRLCGPLQRGLTHPTPRPPLPTLQLVRVYLCDEMVGRMADTLNYFLIYLTGPKRRELKVGAGDRGRGTGAGGREGRAPRQRPGAACLVRTRIVHAWLSAPKRPLLDDQAGQAPSVLTLGRRC